MRERGVAFLLSLAALAAFYALWLRPVPAPDPGGDAARPTSIERRGNGYAALDEWLRRSGVAVRSWRDRYTKLADLDIPPRGNLLVLTLPTIADFESDEYSALDAWVRRGNTLLINAALIDEPAWAEGRSSGAAAEIEALTSIEFESRETREERLDDTPLAERVRRADARDAARERARRQRGGAKDDDDDEEGDVAGLPRRHEVLEAPIEVPLRATGPHPLLAGVSRLSLETDYEPEEWSLRMPYDNFVLTLARDARGEGAFFEQRLGRGRILLSAGGSMFTNRALGDADNAQLMANIVAQCLDTHGVVLFDDLRQGLSALYDPARFFEDPRLYRTIAIAGVLWLVWVLGSTRLRAPASALHDPSEAELVRSAGGLIARSVAPYRVALTLFDDFFARVARASRNHLRLIDSSAARPGPESVELWTWLEGHAAILPQELDSLKTWYADAYAERKVPVAALQNLLDNLERRLKT